MNPLYMNQTVGCASISSADNQQEPKTTVEKVGRHLQKMGQQNENRYLQDMVYRLQNEGAEAIRLLCEEIDALKAEIAAMKIAE